MRINKYIAMHTDHSRRGADTLIAEGRVMVNREKAHPGLSVTDDDVVIVDGKRLTPQQTDTVTILLNKPVGYICSKDGQGSKTVYDLLPEKYHGFNIAGRLDKDSSGLVILTNDGQLLQQLTHPSYSKEKLYKVQLRKELTPQELTRLSGGIQIGDERLSKLTVQPNTAAKDLVASYIIIMQEGRNRQIRRTFESIGNHVVSLHRTSMGAYTLTGIASSAFKQAA